MVAKKSEVEVEIGTLNESGAGYWKIQSMDFLFLEVSLGLILYPGSYAYITNEQAKQIPAYAKKMVTLSEVSEKEYLAKIGSQGILGLG
jgi:hypothetical protein